MMQFLNILLDKPAKFERLILVIWKSLIVIWVISLLNLPNDVVLNPTTEQLWNLEFLTQIEAIQVAIFFGVFVLVWVGVWWLFAKVILTFLVDDISAIWYIILGAFFQVLGTLIYVLVIPFYFHRWKKRPEFPWMFGNDGKPKVKMTDEERSLFDLRKNLKVIEVADKWSKSALGSSIMLLVIEHEKKNFYRSRVFQYLTIILIIGVALTLRIEFGVISTLQLVLFISFWFVVLIIILIVSEIDKIYSGLDEINSYVITKQLETEVFRTMLEKTIKKVFIARYFNFKSTRYNVNLKLKEEFKKSGSTRFKFHNKIIFRIFNPQNVSYKQLSITVKPPKENELLIQVSREIPDIPTRNLLVENNHLLMVATDEIELYQALQALVPTVLNGFKELDEEE